MTKIEGLPMLTAREIENCQSFAAFHREVIAQVIEGCLIANVAPASFPEIIRSVRVELPKAEAPK